MYSFKIKWYMDNDELVDIGFVPGTSLNEALDNILKNYGENVIDNITLGYINDSELLYIPSDSPELIEKIGECNEE